MRLGSDRRYHLILITAGRPTMHGWWGSEAVARDKFVVWVGVYGALPDARVTLVDEETGAVLRALSRCWEPGSLTARRGVVGVRFRAGAQASAG
ncbi:hypothetical protein, partial [Streptomyces sp. NPDC050388]|uniref:hypothetical protein n=1 Tax=Streptomyces sp. NPDC050388 TaxID=3155781 RepID=UPI00341C4358